MKQRSEDLESDLKADRKGEVSQNKVSSGVRYDEFLMLGPQIGVQ